MTPLAARTMAQYNQWMNERLYECCARIPDEERKRDAGAFFKSIHGTLNHLLLGDKIWLGRFLGKPFAVTSLAQQLYADFDELRTERAAIDKVILDWTKSLTAEALTQDLSYTSVVNPKPRCYPLWFAAMQFFNHQTHHRGQLTTLLAQRRIDPGVTDLVWLPGMQSEAR